jgi:hypothetical protein
MPDRAMGWDLQIPVEDLAKPADLTLPLKDDELKQCGDVVPMGRGEPTYTDRNEVRALPLMEPSVENRMAKHEAVIQAMQAGATGSMGCQADPDCGEPFSPPVDIPFGDILAEEFCDSSQTP